MLTETVTTESVITAVITRNDELDAEILAVLAESPGGHMSWAELRRQLPAGVSAWSSTRALVRLHLAGKIDAVKIAGRTFVSVPITLPAR